MKVQTLNSQWFGADGARLDAAFHLSDGRKAKLQVEKCPGGTAPLSDVCSRIFIGSRFRRVYVDDPEKGFPYLTGSDMTKTSPFSGTYLSKAHTRNPKELMIKKGWILITCSGSIGRTVFTNELFEGQIGTHDLIRILPKDDSILAGYLYAYLTCLPGNALITQSTYGGVIQHIEPHHIARLPVPKVAEVLERSIDGRIKEAASLREGANTLLRNAGDRFEELLGIEPSLYKKLTSSLEADFADTFVVERKKVTALTLRARNYGKRLEKIKEVLSVGDCALKDVTKMKPYYTGGYKRIPASNSSAVELLSQGDIFELNPIGLKITPRCVPNLALTITSNGMILVPGQGSLGENEIFGRPVFSWGYLENKVVAQHALRIVPDESKIDAGYLYLVLASKLWFRIFRSSVYGTNLLGFLIPMLNDMPIPRFDPKLESEIGAMAKKAYENLTLALNLEHQAIADLEAEIESW